MADESNKYPVPQADDRLLHDLRWRQHALPMTALAQEVGLFAKLHDKPVNIEEIATMLGVTLRAAEVMVVAVTALGFLEVLKDGRYGLTTIGNTYFVSSSPFYYGRLLAEDNPALEQLRKAFWANEPVQPLAVEMEELPVEKVRRFISNMHSLTFAAASGLADQETFAQVRKLLDVGGGSGSLSMAIAAGHPDIQCTIMDLKSVCVITRENISRYGFEDRIATVEVDMFHDRWPAGYDGVLFGNIFHDWDIDTCKLLAKRAFDVLEPGGSIFLHEMPLSNTKDGPLTVACLSISMLLHEQGRQYALREFREMLTGAGFVDFMAVQTFGYYYLIRATKP